MFKIFHFEIGKTVFAFKIAKVTGPDCHGFALFTKLFKFVVAV